jgi:hypothetical protein
MSIEKKVEITEAQALITGMPEYCSTMTFVVDGKSYTTPEVVALCSSLVAANLTVVQTKGAYHNAVAAERKLQATTGPVISLVRQNLVIAFKSDAAIMGTLQIAAPKTPSPLSAEARVAAEAKATATRLARGTGSKKQKAAVTGNVTGVTITPITAPVASAPATATAPATAPSALPSGAAGGTTSHG